jgi:cell division protein ZapA (FtsZ GTPase activity inhibitor)
LISAGQIFVVRAVNYGDKLMAEQRGMKRAAKVLKRSQRLKKKAKEANLRRLERALNAPEQQAEETSE